MISEKLKKEVLCKTPTGVPCHFFTITEDAHTIVPYKDLMILYMYKEVRDRAYLQSEVRREMKTSIKPHEQRKKEIKHKIFNRNLKGEEVSFETRYIEHLFMHYGKKAMIITARVHPSEAQSSYSLEGFVTWLVSDDERAI